MTGRRSDVGQFKKQVVPRPVFLRPFTGLIVEWADHFQNNLRMLLAQFNDGLCCEHIHTQSTARDKMTIAHVIERLDRRQASANKTGAAAARPQTGATSVTNAPKPESPA